MNRGMLYHGAYYSGIVGAQVSVLPHQQPGAVSSVKPAYDVSLSQQTLRSQLSMPVSAKSIPAQAAFQANNAVGNSSLGPEALVTSVQTSPYNVVRAAQAYHASASGN